MMYDDMMKMYDDDDDDDIDEDDGDVWYSCLVLHMTWIMI